MSGILDLLNSDLGKTLISGASKQFGQDEGKTTSALSTALPLILGAMKNNASTPEGASGLLSALGNSKHSGGILDNLGSVLGGSGVDEDVLTDGAGILGHVFGGKEENVAQAVSKSSGIDLNSAMNILKVAGPLVMGALGKETRQQGVSDQNGIGNLLGGMLGGESSSQQSLVNQLLDADGDGSVIDDVAGMLLGGNSQKKSGLGGMLGGLFGK
ncbi:DUF937 domain-containing protein [Lutibacter sp. A64]|uniref:DUF937 domain-containing protein n=1 Tax=Lutibacter sp. A64 TaxID=2918526 RepID=UPI001F05FB64|nr:DUF937 domain-containing protein [Lutibacter sp. A64]UMB54476.1 DUF937 domain-containing protein [Lutibacter sp. A64]